MKELNNGVFELTDEQLAKVTGGARGTGSCPNGYTKCTKDNCLNANCGQLVQNGNVYTCYCVGNTFSYTPISIDYKYEGDEVNTKF